MSKDSGNILLYGGLAALGLFIMSTSEKSQASANTADEDHTPPVKTPTQFIKKYYPEALDSEYATGVPAVVTVAQGGLESGWGKSGYGNNFFGIKVGSSWDGAIQKLKTWECGKTNDEVIQVFPPGTPGANPNCSNAGKTSYRVYGKFRAYPNASAGFMDHGRFLKDNKRYSKAFAYTKSPEQFALEIARAGYATAPNYGTILVDTIRNIRKVQEQSGGSW